MSGIEEENVADPPFEEEEEEEEEEGKQRNNNTANKKKIVSLSGMERGETAGENTFFLKPRRKFQGGLAIV